MHDAVCTILSLTVFLTLRIRVTVARVEFSLSQSVSQSILEEKLGKKDSHRHFPMQLEIIGHLHRK